MECSSKSDKLAILTPEFKYDPISNSCIHQTTTSTPPTTFTTIASSSTKAGAADHGPGVDGGTTSTAATLGTTSATTVSSSTSTTSTTQTRDTNRSDFLILRIFFPCPPNSDMDIYPL